MTLLQKLSLVASLGSATFSIAASVPNKIIQPDNIVLCEPGAGCVNKTLHGRSYKVITTPRFTVMVSISNEGVYTRADVSIANHTDTPLSMTPEDFRVEVITPKPKVLLYVAPAKLNLPPPRQPAAAPAPQPAAAPVPPLPAGAASFASQQSAPAAAETTPAQEANDVEALYAVAEQKAATQEAAEKAAAEKHLSATSIPPNEATSGRVYFERDKKSHMVNVVLPIAGLVFEFPYAMK